jgi:hypothetical protein
METIIPEVNSNAEFLEIVTDFGNPLEVFREAISNAVDAGATRVIIDCSVPSYNGNPRLKLVIEDNGLGMSKEILTTEFWGLGFSSTRDRKQNLDASEYSPIGEKGHGTKIYLRSEYVKVITKSSDGSFTSICEEPFARLSRNDLHSPYVIDESNELPGFGTRIEIIGYNDNVRDQFQQKIVKDYLLWFTKVGSIERQFGINDLENFEVQLRCIGEKNFEIIRFGHPFPPENSNIDELFRLHSVDAADHYVKYYKEEGRLERFPEVDYQIFIAVEGDSVKRSYNRLLRERVRTQGDYRVADRYGLWICKDFIPITRVNEWISGFGSGSNAFGLLHGFINCQSLRLTANRGTIANTNPAYIQELESVVKRIVDKIDTELAENGIETLRGWQKEERTKEKEKAEYKRRTQEIRRRSKGKYSKDGKEYIFVEPLNESEVFGIFMQVLTLHPELFEFRPLDYNTTNGIDIIAINKSASAIIEQEFQYVELKYDIPKQFNHGFELISWIVAWRIGKKVGAGGVVENADGKDRRNLVVESDDNETYYYLTSPSAKRRIQILPLEDIMKFKLGIHFEPGF